MLFLRGYLVYSNNNTLKVFQMIWRGKKMCFSRALLIGVWMWVSSLKWVENKHLSSFAPCSDSLCGAFLSGSQSTVDFYKVGGCGG